MPPQRVAHDAGDGDLTDIDLGSPSNDALAPERDGPVPLSTPLQPNAGLSNGALATPQPRSAGASSSSQADDPDEIVLGGGMQSIKLTTYEDSEPLPPGTVAAGSQASDKQVRPAQ